jgi:hypothetical protein
VQYPGGWQHQVQPPHTMDAQLQHRAYSNHHASQHTEPVQQPPQGYFGSVVNNPSNILNFSTSNQHTPVMPGLGMAQAPWESAGQHPYPHQGQADQMQGPRPQPQQVHSGPQPYAQQQHRHQQQPQQAAQGQSGLQQQYQQEGGMNGAGGRQRPRMVTVPQPPRLMHEPHQMSPTVRYLGSSHPSPSHSTTGGLPPGSSPAHVGGV